MIRFSILSFFCFLFFAPLGLFSQDQIKGRVVYKDQSGMEVPLPGANVYWSDLSATTTTDDQGFFFLNRKKEGSLVASFVGYVNDTLQERGRKHFHFVLKSSEDVLEEVEVKSSSTFISKVEPTHTEYISSRELTKAPCCNLSESFETNASVDVSTTDAVTGTKQIQMLGLSGKYAPLVRENIPVFNSLLINHGLHLVPGTSVSSIAISKGPASVINGYHSMTGMINYQLLQPNKGDKLMLNLFGSSIGRLEFNGNLGNVKLPNDSSYFNAMVHYSEIFHERDVNNDGFRDYPKSQRGSFMGRWKKFGKKYNTQLGVILAQENAEGGEMGFTREQAETLYGAVAKVKNFEIFGSTGFLFPKSPHRGIGTLYSYSRSEIDSEYGPKSYSGSSDEIRLNLLYQTQIANKNHTILTSGSFYGNRQEENYNDSIFSREEVVPGVSGEYTFSGINRLSIVLGARLDHHNIVGTKGVGRLHVKYDPDEKSVFRLTFGNGWRVPSIYAENIKMYPSSRVIKQLSDPAEEEAISLGLTYTRDIKTNFGQYNLGLDFFRTEFTKQILVDYDQDYQSVYLYNLNGESYSNSFQAQFGGSPVAGFNFTVAYKWYDVKMKMAEGLMRAPFVPEHRGFLQASYATAFDRWVFDYTLNWFGKKRIPGGSGRPDQYAVREFSPDFFTMNFQITKKLRWVELYGGIENLADVRQEDPIVDPQNPFGPNFDAGLAWGPTVGRVFYLGVRYKLLK